MKVRHSQLLPTTGCKAAFELGNKLKGVGDDDDNDDDDFDGDDDDDDVLDETSTKQVRVTASPW